MTSDHRTLVHHVPIFARYVASLCVKLIDVRPMPSDWSLNHLVWSLTVLAWDFCVNILAGVVASTIFINNNQLMKGWTFGCVLLVIILKVVNTKAFRKYAGRKWQTFVTNPRAAPGLPTGARSQ